MRMRIATWNVNSVRQRLDHLARFIDEAGPDVLCLQEIKCQTPEFPVSFFEDLGFGHMRIAGQKGWHGVAIVSRLPLSDGPALDMCREGHARAVSARVGEIDIVNLYVPAGGDVADRMENPKFDHKLDFVDRLRGFSSRQDPTRPLIMTGDFNIAPGEFDVWSHKQMSRVVSHTPVEIEALQAWQTAGGFVDLPRMAIPEPEKLFSWWSYRASNFRSSNRGLRLDHIWASPGLAKGLAIRDHRLSRVHDHVREWDKPSDHAPVTAEINVQA